MRSKFLKVVYQSRSIRKINSVSHQRSDVEYAEPDYIVHLLNTPDDLLFPQMWSLLNTGQQGGTSGDDIGATLAWNFTQQAITMSSSQPSILASISLTRISFRTCFTIHRFATV